MALDHRTKVFGVKEARIVKLLTDVPGQAATYSGAGAVGTTAVLASPTPTTTVFTITAGGGAILTTGGAVPGRTITVGTAIGVLTSIVGDVITLAVALPAAPSTGAVVTVTSGFPVTGCKALVSNTTMVTVDLRGDNTFLDTDSVLQGVGVEIDYAKLSFDVINIMLGGVVTDTGTTPNQQTTWSLPTQPTFNYFRLEARCFTTDAPNGDLHVVFNKVKAADAPLTGLAEENYDMPKIKCKAVPPVGTTPWIQYVYNETGLPIA